MNKPNGYDEAKASGEFIPVEQGGHYAVIKQVSERNSSTGKPMIVVLFDFTAPDKQQGYFTAAFNADDRPEKKWPFAGSKYIMVNDYQDPSKTSRKFKTFCSCVEKSNNYEILWGGNDWGKQFVGKKIGVVYGQEENEYDGKTFMRTVPVYFCKIDSVADAKVPKPTYLNGSSPANTPAASAVDPNTFMAIPDDMSEEIPF